MACLSMKLLPAGTSGHEADIPRRLTRRQKRIPIRTSGPLLKRIVVSGRRISASYPSLVRRPALSHTQSGAEFSPPLGVVRMSACTPAAFTKRSYELCPLPTGSRLRPTQSSFQSWSRRLSVLLTLSGSGSRHRKAT